MYQASPYRRAYPFYQEPTCFNTPGCEFETKEKLSKVRPLQLRGAELGIVTAYSRIQKIQKLLAALAQRETLFVPTPGSPSEFDDVVAAAPQVSASSASLTPGPAPVGATPSARFTSHPSPIAIGVVGGQSELAFGCGGCYHTDDLHFQRICCNLDVVTEKAPFGKFFPVNYRSV